MDRLQMQIRNSNISVSFLLKVRDHPERVQKGKCKANSGKKKKNVLCILTLMLGSLSLAVDSDLYLFGFIFPIIVWTNRLNDFDKGICFPDNWCYNIG